MGELSESSGSQNGLKRSRQHPEEVEEQQCASTCAGDDTGKLLSHKNNKERDGNKGKRRSESASANARVREIAMEKAEEIQMGLARDFPSFVKCMTPSNSTWMHLPADFCKAAHLPDENADFFLIDENLDAHRVVYIACKRALSAGWGGFVKVHGLIEGDVLVFHLVNKTTFKVYIIRSKDVSAALGHVPKKKTEMNTSMVPSLNTHRSRVKHMRQRNRVMINGLKEASKHNGQSLELTCQGGKSTDITCHNHSDCLRRSARLSNLHLADDTKPTKYTISASGPTFSEPPSYRNASLSTKTCTRHCKNINCKGKCASCISQNANIHHTAGCFQCFKLKDELRRRTKDAETAINESLELKYFMSCKVCMEVQVCMLLMPCKHICLCKECEPKLHVCPICNTAKVSSVEVFLS